MKKGILLINLGTPETPDSTGVRRFLADFLSDPEVLDLPMLVRLILLYGIILPFRTSKTTHAYQSIWSPEGSPLRVYTMKLAEALQKRLGDKYQIAVGMRYGEPSIASACTALQACESIHILPLYPQYALSTTESALQACYAALRRVPSRVRVHIVRDFFDHPGYIEPLASIIRAHHTPDTHLILSFHGLPVRHLNKAGCTQLCQQACPKHKDATAQCYRAQCFASSRAIARALALEPEAYTVAFQSRFGKTTWIGPDLIEIMSSLREKGITRLLIATPAFTSDCLETLEEIGIRARAHWLASGGSQCDLVPCLNDNPEWVEGIVRILTGLASFT